MAEPKTFTTQEQIDISTIPFNIDDVDNPFDDWRNTGVSWIFDLSCDAVSTQGTIHATRAAEVLHNFVVGHPGYGFTQNRMLCFCTVIAFRPIHIV